MTLLLVALLIAQIFPTAYTTDDPVDPNRMGLATMDGRYQMEVVPGWCGWSITSGQNVTFQNSPAPFNSGITEDGIGYFKLTLDDRVDCIVYIHQKMDPTPCNTNSDGVCDAGMVEQGQ